MGVLSLNFMKVIIVKACQNYHYHREILTQLKYAVCLLKVRYLGGGQIRINPEKK